MITIARIKLAVRPITRFLKFKILHVDDSPPRIARGVMIGLFVAWSPFYGLHILLALALSLLFKANKFVAVLCVWVSNAFTLVPIYYPNYLIGRGILSLFRKERVLSGEQVADFFGTLCNPQTILIDVFTPTFWRNFVKFFLGIGIELTIGGFIIGLIVSLAAYIVTLKTIRWYRTKHPHKRYAKHNC